MSHFLLVISYVSFLVSHTVSEITVILSDVSEVEDPKKDVPLASINWRKDRQIVLNVLLAPSVTHWYVHCIL